MFKQFLRRHAASRESIQQHRWAKVFGTALHHPHLWHINRRSTARAAAIGLFWCVIPIPFQMFPSAAFAIWLRGNVAIAATLAWISNPLTIPPLYYATYRLGKWILGTELASMPEVRWARIADWALWSEVGTWLSTNAQLIWKPLLLGSTVAGTAMGLAGYLLVGLSWKWHIRRRWRQRRRTAPATA